MEAFNIDDNEKEIQIEQKSVRDTKKLMLWIICGLLAILIGLGIWFAMTISSQNEELEAAITAKEKAELDATQRELEQQYEDLTTGLSTLENQRQLVLDDSVKRDLSVKYENARLQVEKLQQELKNLKNMSAAEIEKLKGEIKTLRELLKHYVEEIDRLNKENADLRNQNAEMKDQNQRLSSQVEETSRKNEVLTERMTLAEKLNVTGLELKALNKKGKNEKNVKKAKQLMVTFTIPQNNSTPVGAKTIYLRLTSPSGQLLGDAGTFAFEGGDLVCSAKTTIEYAGEEIGGVRIFWDVNTALTAGEYTVELFADNFRLISRAFTLK